MTSLKLLCAVTGNADLVPHFLRHYTQQGVTHFYFFRYASANEILVPEDYKNSVTILNSCCVEGEKEYDCLVLQPQRILQKIYVRAHEWFVVTDLDEFTTMPDNKKIIDVIRSSESQGYNYIDGYFCDRLTSDNSIPASLDENIWKQFPQSTDFTKKIVQGSTKKCVATKGKIQLNPGHHREEDAHTSLVKMSPVVGTVHHFKWWGNVLERMHKRYYERLKLTPDYKYAEECVRVCRYFNYKHLQDMLDVKPPPGYK